MEGTAELWWMDLEPYPGPYGSHATAWSDQGSDPIQDLLDAIALMKQNAY